MNECSTCMFLGIDRKKPKVSYFCFARRVKVINPAQKTCSSFKKKEGAFSINIIDKIMPTISLPDFKHELYGADTEIEIGEFKKDIIVSFIRQYNETKDPEIKRGIEHSFIEIFGIPLKE